MENKIEKTATTLDAKAVIERANEEKRVIKFTERVKLEITEDFGYHKKGDIIRPHKIMAEQYLKEKKAKKA